MSARVCAQFELRALGDSAATQREQLDDGFCLGFLLQARIQKKSAMLTGLRTVGRICPFGSLVATYRDGH